MPTDLGNWPSHYYFHNLLDDDVGYCCVIDGLQAHVDEILGFFTVCLVLLSSRTTERQKCLCLMCGAVHGADTTVRFGHFIDFVMHSTSAHCFH